MAFNPKAWISGYLKKKKPFAIATDIFFIVFIVLLIIPGTRKEFSSLLIRLTSLPPSTLATDEQYNVNKAVNLWQLYDQKDHPVTFGKLNEKPVFINFWATWCPPCIAELPGISELYEKYKADVNFVFVSNESPETVKKFALKHDYQDLPFYFSGTVPPDFASNSIPATFIISRTGKVVVVKRGAARWNTGKTETILKQLIKE
ncbi:MAG TPA: TlpA family protein disulfide reductase [Bacteroidetes bacterium]|nr:TlpA family protein disulfide reductase [Bacteroidota bacterium]